MRQIKKRLAEKCLLKRRRSKRVGTILSECPGIGAEIEDFDKQCGAGADAWRRTGTLTFDGNRKVQKKATFRRIQQHLQDKYHRSISYGTVVQLCCARNKRRRSAARYHGLANVVSKQARKGFTIRYNPDTHWSSALYAALDKIQYRSGENIMNVGRDDQAGFRLDTMATHKLHATLCVKGSEHQLGIKWEIFPLLGKTWDKKFLFWDNVGKMSHSILKTGFHWEINCAFSCIPILGKYCEYLPMLFPKLGKIGNISPSYSQT